MTYYLQGIRQLFQASIFLSVIYPCNSAPLAAPANNHGIYGVVIIAIDYLSESVVALNNSQLIANCGVDYTSLDYSVIPEKNRSVCDKIDCSLKQLQTSKDTMELTSYGEARISLVVIRNDAKRDTLFVDNRGRMWYKGVVYFPNIVLLKIIVGHLPATIKKYYNIAYKELLRRSSTEGLNKYNNRE